MNKTVDLFGLCSVINTTTQGKNIPSHPIPYTFGQGVGILSFLFLMLVIKLSDLQMLVSLLPRELHSSQPALVTFSYFSVALTKAA